MNSSTNILQQYWGYNSFRPLQAEIIEAIMDKKDVLALLPTGGGKSICFQVPALMQEGICLVISPLIALIKDQVEGLQKKGILALSIYAGMSFLDTKKILQNAAYGNYKFLYVSPERLETDLFLEYLPAMQISFIAVDEAHCISQWGYDFRPSYLRIAALREHLPNTPIIALTASATKIVQEDICEKLLFTKPYVTFQQSFERYNLSYSVFEVASKQNKLIEILQSVKGSAIVYCKSRRYTKEVANLLQLHQISADFYHAGLTSEERTQRQENWINNKIRVMVCTNAFGMGIDKPNVRVVVHYDVPDCIENYYQEAGRAGRDGLRAYAVLLYTHKELLNLQQQSNIRYADLETIKIVYVAIMNYLQIAAGSGDQQSYEFDMGIFCTKFKLNIIQVSYIIKTLEQEGIIAFSESFFKPSTLVFTINKNDLTEIEIQQPQLEPLLKGLLRSYAGIFDFPVTISETKLASFIQQPLHKIKIDLEKLNNLGIVDYTPQKQKPQITLLQNRMYADNYFLNLNNHLKRKKGVEKRVAAIIEYIENKQICRSKILATYFSAPIKNNCQICDNCISLLAVTISSKDFDEIKKNILNLLHIQKNITSKQIETSLKQHKKDHIGKVLHYLLSENLLQMDELGNLFQ